MTWKQQVIKDGLLKSKNGTVGATLSIAIVADKIGVITEIYITGWKYIIYRIYIPDALYNIDIKCPSNSLCRVFPLALAWK